MALAKRKEREQEKQHESKPEPKHEKPSKDPFGPDRPFEILGQPVALATCRECGSAVFSDAKDLHQRWHA